MNGISERRWFEIFFWKFGLRIYSRPAQRPAKQTSKLAKSKIERGKELLADVRKVIEALPGLRSLFGIRPVRIASVDLARSLSELPGGKWAKMHPIWLARMLKPLGIHPRNYRIGGKIAKGYDFTQLVKNNWVIAENGKVGSLS